MRKTIPNYPRLHLKAVELLDSGRCLVHTMSMHLLPSTEPALLSGCFQVASLNGA